MANIEDRVNVGVGALVAREFYDGTRILLGKRINDKHGKGEFSFPSDKPDPGENPAKACARELFEETGMYTKSIIPIPVWTYERYEDWGVHFVTLFFECITTDEPQNKEPDKCEGWYWHRIDRLPEPLFSGTVEALSAWR